MTFKLLIATLVASCSLAACAAPSDGMLGDAEARADLPMPRSRAEVIADLEIYRRSGLAVLDASESPDVFSKAYAEAQARYQALRASPDFAQLVARIARERGEVQATARSGDAALAR